jgi:hypothetical protein
VDCSKHFSLLDIHFKNKGASSRHKTKQAGLTALSAWHTCKPDCLVSLTVLSAWLPCQPLSIVSLFALMGCLLCFVPATSACISSVCLWRTLTVLTRQTRQAVHAINQFTFLRCLWVLLSPQPVFFVFYLPSGQYYKHFTDIVVKTINANWLHTPTRFHYEGENFQCYETKQRGAKLLNFSGKSRT